MLWLPIKQRWFNLILQGTKKEEYREPKPYWLKRIAKEMGIQSLDISNINQIIGREIKITLRAGYKKNSDTLVARCVLDYNIPKKEWCYETNRKLLIFRITEIEFCCIYNKRSGLLAFIGTYALFKQARGASI